MASSARFFLLVMATGRPSPRRRENSPSNCRFSFSILLSPCGSTTDIPRVPGTRSCCCASILQLFYTAFTVAKWWVYAGRVFIIPNELHAPQGRSHMHDTRAIIAIRRGHSVWERAITVIARWFKYRRDRLRLESMTDSELRDIGLNRGDIGYVIRNGRD